MQIGGRKVEVPGVAVLAILLLLIIFGGRGVAELRSVVNSLPERGELLKEGKLFIIPATFGYFSVYADVFTRVNVLVNVWPVGTSIVPLMVLYPVFLISITWLPAAVG